MEIPLSPTHPCASTSTNTSTSADLVLLSPSFYTLAPADRVFSTSTASDHPGSRAYSRHSSAGAGNFVAFSFGSFCILVERFCAARCCGFCSVRSCSCLAA